LDTDFGSLVAEGYAIVPGLAGRTAEESRSILEDVGLVFEEDEAWQFHDTIPRGIVISQEPPAGRQLEVGEAVTVNISMGPLLEAISDGIIPNPVGMTIVEGIGFSHSLRDAMIWSQFTYEYSNTVPVGVITELVHTPGSNGVMFFISVGPDDGNPPYGTLRAPFISGSYREVILYVAAASANFYDPDKPDDRFYTEWDFQISNDRSNWTSLMRRGTNMTMYYYLQDEDRERGNVAPRTISYVSDALMSMLLNGELQNGTHYLRALQHWSEDWSPSQSREERFLSSIDIPQTLEVEITPAVVEIYSIEVIEWEDIEHLLTDNMHSNWELRQAYQDNRDGNVPVRVTGNFKSQTYYEYIITFENDHGSYNNRGVHIQEEGEFHIPVSIPGNDAFYSYNLIIYEGIDVTSNKDGSRITYRRDRPAVERFRVFQPDHFELPVRGMDPADARIAISEFTGMDNDYRISNGFVPDDEIPRGKALTWAGQKRNDNYSSAYLWISLGPGGDEPYVVPVFGAYNTHGDMDSVLDLPIFGFWFGRYDFLLYTFEYQGDYDTEWQHMSQNAVHSDSIYRNMISPSLWSLSGNTSRVKLRVRLFETDGYYQPLGPVLFEAEFDVPIR